VSFRDTRPARTFIEIIVLAALAAVPACRSGDEGARRVFVAPLANLSAAPTLDWFGRAVSGLIVSRTPGQSAVQTVASSDRYATHSLEGYFSERSGLIHIHAALRDLSSRRIVRTIETSGSESDLLKISETLSRAVAGNAQSYTTSSVDAVRNLYTAQFDAAIAADPAFGAAHLARLETLRSLGRREEAMEALDLAAGPGVRFTPEEKLRLAEARAIFAGTVATRVRMARELARQRPADMQRWRTAAELALLAKDYPAAIDAYNNALKLDPEDPQLWNTLGYAHAYSGDLASARKALEEYRRIAPDDPNAFDSLGEVHYYLGRFAEAEKYFLEAFEKNQAALGGGEALRAGMAGLMRGDRSTADRHFAAYIDVRKEAGDTLVPVRQALWLFWTGRRTQAIAELTKISEPAEAAVAARLLLTLWQVQLGERAEARKSAAEALQFAKSPQLVPNAAVARFLASPPGPGASAAAGNDPGRRQLLGYSLLLHGNYAAAAQLWSGIYNATSALSAQDERILLAWAQAELGNLPEVAALMRAYALPPSGADPGLQSILFPRSIYLKALAEQHAGNRVESLRLFKLFVTYSGDQDFAYGEERRARNAR
jgi:tetratricopeptide (TPR) repeat protein